MCFHFPVSFQILFMMVYEGSSLECQQSEYELNERCCPLCPAGERVEDDCTKSKPTTCTNCTEGTYMDHPTEDRKCSDCTNCDGSGLKTKTSCTTTSDTVCEPLEGFHCVDFTDQGCRAAKKHLSCHPGQFINQTGTELSDTVCSNCTEGTFSNGSFTSCQPHTMCATLIKPGTLSTDAECGGNISEWIIISGIVCAPILILLVIVLVYYAIKKKCCHRGTGTHKELRTTSNGKPNSITDREQTNHMVNGTA